jgi:hypothetical protein
MINLNEFGGGVIVGIVLAIIYGVVFTSEYPLAHVDAALVALFAVAGLFTYIIIRWIARVLLKS